MINCSRRKTTTSYGISQWHSYRKSLSYFSIFLLFTINGLTCHFKCETHLFRFRFLTRANKSIDFLPNTAAAAMAVFWSGSYSHTISQLPCRYILTPVQFYQHKTTLLLSLSGRGPYNFPTLINT